MKPRESDGRPQLPPKPVNFTRWLVTFWYKDADHQSVRLNSREQAVTMFDVLLANRYSVQIVEEPKEW